MDITSKIMYPFNKIGQHLPFKLQKENRKSKTIKKILKIKIKVLIKFG